MIIIISKNKQVTSTADSQRIYGKSTYVMRTNPTNPFNTFALVPYVIIVGRVNIMSGSERDFEWLDFFFQIWFWQNISHWMSIIIYLPCEFRCIFVLFSAHWEYWVRSRALVMHSKCKFNQVVLLWRSIFTNPSRTRQHRYRIIYFKLLLLLL